MQDLDVYRARHAEIRDIIARLEPLMDHRQLSLEDNALIAQQLLCELGVKVKDHLSAEDKGLYPDLLIHQDNSVKSLAWGFISGEKPLRQLFEHYRRQWLNDCNCDFSAPFLAETQDIFRLIKERIEREETLLFPKLEEICTPPRPFERSGIGLR